MVDPRPAGDRAELREVLQQQGGLDARTLSLVKIAALVARDAAPASYLRQVREALDAGAAPQEIIAVLRAVVPIGGASVIVAAPKIMEAIGMSGAATDVTRQRNRS